MLSIKAGIFYDLLMGRIMPIFKNFYLLLVVILIFSINTEVILTSFMSKKAMQPGPNGYLVIGRGPIEIKSFKGPKKAVT